MQSTIYVNSRIGMNTLFHSFHHSGSLIITSIFLQPLKSTAGVSRRFLLDLVQQQEADLQENDQHIRKLLAAVKERDVELENYDRLLDSHVLVNNALDTLQQYSLTLTALIVTENFEKER